MLIRLGDLGHAAVGLLERQEWLAPIEDRLQRLVGTTLARAGRRVRNFLHGTWLGHPLHPVLTDVPIGAWTMAVILDALDTGDRQGRYSAAADRAVAVGITGAVVAATSGLADWHHTAGSSRRTGFAHALLNTLALGLWSASLVARRRGAGASARTLGAAGYLVVLASAWLGGTLIYHDRIGVDHSRRPRRPAPPTVVLDSHAVGEGERRRVEVDGIPVLLVRHAGRVHALGETCAHLGGPLAEGVIEDGTVVCPWHGSRFALADGRVIEGPATLPQPCFEVREASGQIVLRSAA